MISPMGKKIFFVNPPESLKSDFLEFIFKNEFELYLLENSDKIDNLLDIFHDAVIFINIDKGMTHPEWINHIRLLKKKWKNVIFAIFSKSTSSSLQKTFLIDIEVGGGYIHLDQDNWKAIELINSVLEANEARGRRKSVRLDFNKNDSRGNLKARVYTQNGYSLDGIIESCSSTGLLISFKNGRSIEKDDNVDKVVFSLEDNELHIKGYLLKRFENGNYFISFEDIRDEEKAFVQKFIFDSLQNGFRELLKKL